MRQHPPMHQPLRSTEETNMVVKAAILAGFGITTRVEEKVVGDEEKAG